MKPLRPVSIIITQILMALSVVNLKNIYTFSQTMRGVLVLGSRACDGVTIFDLSLKSVLMLLVFLLFLKVWLCKRKGRFLDPKEYSYDRCICNFSLRRQFR